MALSWDIFCTVIDNFGDIGVCWRLARQLRHEHHAEVRLWVDDLAAFALICPDFDPALPAMLVDGIDIRAWHTPFPLVTPHDVVIEAFACDPPASFLQAMGQRLPHPIWLNLEYLSAEPWVEDCHQLRSRHSTLPLSRYFFFPGFTNATGGLIRESGLVSTRSTFKIDVAAQHDFLGRLGITTEQAARQRISLFCYDNPALLPLLSHWTLDEAKLVFVAEGKPRHQVETWLGSPFPIGSQVTNGALTLVALPFLTQGDYDRLLWLCDINFVRGEDSFVRAQWAAKPLLWHIYSQDDNVHLKKLDAFLARHHQDLDAGLADTQRMLQHAWNVGDGASVVCLWPSIQANLPQLAKHAESWCDKLCVQDDLATQLNRFVLEICSRDS